VMAAICCNKLIPKTPIPSKFGTLALAVRSMTLAWNLPEKRNCSHLKTAKVVQLSSAFVSTCKFLYPPRIYEKNTLTSCTDTNARDGWEQIFTFASRDRRCVGGSGRPHKMREIRTSGLMSGIWKRKIRSAIQTPTNRKGRQTV
jgi:hypothetical protein